MRHKKRKKERADATRASVKKEMAKPRMARSARMMELILDTTRIPDSQVPLSREQSTKSSRVQSRPEKTQIAVDRADPRYRDLRIENKLSDEHGDDVKLKKGAHVEVTVTAEPKK